MQLTSAIIEGFCNSVLRKNFDCPAETPEFHRELWELCCSPRRYVAVAAPRNHAKSTAVTHTYTLACILFRQYDYVLIVSDTVTQAIQFLGDIKKELTDNEDLIKLFGVGEFEKDTEDDIIVRFDDGKLFRIQAKGAEQKLRGLKWANKRPNLVVVDDLENDEAVVNKDRREKLKRWFNGALLPCLSSDGVIRVVGTILHLDALLESLMPENQLKTSLTQKKKLLHENELKQWTDHRTPWHSVKYWAHNQDFSSLLWPDRWSKDKLIQLRDTMLSQGLGDVYSQEMLNRPLDESNTFFKRQDFISMKDPDYEKNLNYYITCDLAVSTGQYSDYTVFTVGGVDSENRLYLVNVIRDRMDTSQIVSTMLGLNKTYSPIIFGVEKGSIQKSIGPFLNEEMIKHGNYLPLELLAPSLDKVQRARSMQARMRIGAVKFDKDAEWYSIFESELLRFPRDRHDDQVDAWAYMGLMLDKMSEALTNEEIEELEYIEELETSGSMDSRNLHTGY